MMQEAAATVLQQLDQLGTTQCQSAQVAQRLETLFAYSPYLLQICQRYPEQLRWLIDSGALLADARAVNRATHVERIMATDSPELGVFGRVQNNIPTALFDQQLAQLRKFRHQQMLRIIWRDLVGVASVDETLLALSTMADACIEVASIWSHEAVSARYGQALDADGRQCVVRYRSDLYLPTLREQ